MPRQLSRTVVLGVALWIPAVALGVGSLLRYTYTPGKAATPLDRWPSDSSIFPAHGRDTLVLFAHPQCPCSDATIGELAELTAHTREKLDTYVFFYAPGQETEDWVHAALWRRAERIPGVHVLEDRDGSEARSFHALTSGQAFLYDRGGLLLFSGGITAARGHSGGNAGRDAILSMVLDGVSPRTMPLPRTTPVFGCSLIDESRQ